MLHSPGIFDHLSPLLRKILARCSRFDLPENRKVHGRLFSFGSTLIFLAPPIFEIGAIATKAAALVVKRLAQR
jgi:hypothetical protein